METWDEMSQYLKSIKKVAASQKLGEEYSWAGKFEVHVYFDNGARGSKLTDFSAQLVCLVQSIFKGNYTGNFLCSLQLPLHIHLKDNQEVKSKKRWSQVMYMESAIDRISHEDDSSVKYILATDGDVDFDADSIVAMLLQMLSDREEDVGAVCARTHPVGSGPLVWYQMFDYAIGHWLQKVANHVLGSVLCSPGCFSVYRVEAIADVLEEYRSDVEEASDFLTKDMGEDRWFTTLLVKAGWKINYCAGAVDSTHCPEEFGEFWKQRRRWIPSTLANQILLLKNWKDVKKNNKYISMGFLLYQVILLLSTVISPSTCILTITGSTFLCG
ncbi:chitin synthase chs-2-like [Branchiostoma floridae]|uniref:chitin synthase n=1 Tax=Branchiostoma floridae TaxID=7739 RepID=A0A9J7KS87_BRAFL|nr:chitin synthase chs-2-like [Branchiostoma floridae]